MPLDPTALELFVYLPHRDLVLRDAAPGRADPPAVGRLAERYAARALSRYNGETSSGLVARCAGVLIYAMDGYGLTFEDVCGLADHEVATVLAQVTPDNRMTEPIRHLRLREALGLAQEVGQLIKLAEISTFAGRALRELTPGDYLEHAQHLKHVVDRHAQLLQAMGRLAAREATGRRRRGDAAGAGPRRAGDRRGPGVPQGREGRSALATQLKGKSADPKDTTMLMVRRKRGRWIHCIHEKSGDPVSFQIKEIARVGSEYQVTIAIQDDPHNYTILKPGDRDHPLPPEGNTGGR